MGTVGQPFYDPAKTYEDNYLHGPFGAFSHKPKKVFSVAAKSKFLNFKIDLPFGIPAGPIINSNFVKAAFNHGFSIVTYKTVRSCSFPCHPWPNIVPLKFKGNLTESKFGEPLVKANKFVPKITQLTITNSFGVPSKDPGVWQNDVKKALVYQNGGKLLILSFMGTKQAGFRENDFMRDFGTAAWLAKETGALILEVNLSCPNMGKEGLVCYDIQRSQEICEIIKNKIGNTPLLVKIGYFSQKEEPLLEKLINSIHKHIAGICAINTIQMDIVDNSGKQALPGEGRLRSGVCGRGIKKCGLNMVGRLKKIKEKNGFHFAVVGIGGVMDAEDFLLYRQTGADVVQSATGAMWNPMLGFQISKFISANSN